MRFGSFVFSISGDPNLDLGAGEHDGDCPIVIRPDGDLPPDVLARLQPPRLDHLAPCHRERVVLHGLVAEGNLLAEAQLEGEGVASVGIRHPG